jgi:hypothetical protein
MRLYLRGGGEGGGCEQGPEGKKMEQFYYNKPTTRRGPGKKRSVNFED